MKSLTLVVGSAGPCLPLPLDFVFDFGAESQRQFVEVSAVSGVGEGDGKERVVGEGRKVYS